MWLCMGLNKQRARLIVVHIFLSYLFNYVQIYQLWEFRRGREISSYSPNRADEGDELVTVFGTSLQHPTMAANGIRFIFQECVGWGS